MFFHRNVSNVLSHFSSVTCFKPIINQIRFNCSQNIVKSTFSWEIYVQRKLMRCQRDLQNLTKQMNDVGQNLNKITRGLIDQQSTMYSRGSIYFAAERKRLKSCGHKKINYELSKQCHQNLLKQYYSLIQLQKTLVSGKLDLQDKLLKIQDEYKKIASK